MRALIIGPDEQAAIAKAVAYAMEPDHFFRVGSGVIPGDDPNYVTHVPDGFRCVFTFTKHGGKVFRHLTVSVPKEGMYPSPEAMITLAKEYGFTASDDRLDFVTRMEKDRWLISTGHQGENCCVAVQPID